jgi:hypothetical protein
VWTPRSVETNEAADRKSSSIEPALLPAAKGVPSGVSPERPEGGATARFISWSTRYNAVLTLAAACIAPILYLVFIYLYATNSFYGDDWSVTPMIHSALSQHLLPSQLWAQYNESRLLVGNVIDVLFGFIDRFDLRSVILFSAALFIASYAVLLALFRQYVGKRLTPIPVLLIGMTWFSLADVQNSLWAFQVSWYLTVLFLVVMLFALEVPNSRRTLWFTVAIVAGCAASLSTIQGFVCWPLGALCILWSQPRTRRVVREAALWFGTMIVTAALYFPGYNFHENGCAGSAICSPRIALHHPVTAVGYFFAIIGYVIPDGFDFGGVYRSGHNAARLELVGGALFAAAVFILVQSWRYRASRDRFPLPLLLIGFSLLFDVTIALGRSGLGISNAAFSNRYVMPNLMLFTGIVMYAWAHMPPRHLPSANGAWKTRMAWLALIALALFLVVQVTEATAFGLMEGRATSESLTDEARLAVNLDRVPTNEVLCEQYVEYFPQVVWSYSKARDASEDHLGEFLPASYRYYRTLGLPALFPGCSRLRK